MTGLVLSGNTTNCPVCGSRANVVDGEFNVKDSIIEIISAPETSRDILRAFLGIVQQAESGEISHKEAVKKADQLDRKYGYILRAAFGSLPVLTLLITLLQTYLQFDGNRSSSEDLKRILNAVNAQTTVLTNRTDDGHVRTKPKKKAQPKAAVKPELNETPSSRRAQVKEERKRRLKERRAEFGRSRTR